MLTLATLSLAGVLDNLREKRIPATELRALRSRQRLHGTTLSLGYVSAGVGALSSGLGTLLSIFFWPRRDSGAGASPATTVPHVLLQPTEGGAAVTLGLRF